MPVGAAQGVCVGRWTPHHVLPKVRACGREGMPHHVLLKVRACGREGMPHHVPEGAAQGAPPHHCLQFPGNCHAGQGFAFRDNVQGFGATCAPCGFKVSVLRVHHAGSGFRC
eukprot:350839-Chlamydomonas_euryale.AAC.5